MLMTAMGKRRFCQLPNILRLEIHGDEDYKEGAAILCVLIPGDGQQRLRPTTGSRTRAIGQPLSNLRVLDCTSAALMSSLHLICINYSSRKFHCLPPLEMDKVFDLPA